jgi:hypothetical protein
MRENNPKRQAWQAAADKNGKGVVIKASQGNIPAEAEPQTGHRGYLHA